MTSHLTATAALAALLLAGCGGGNGGTDTAQPTGDDAASVPASAADSPQALIRYQQAMDPDDRAEPKALPSVALPLDDTAEPTPLG